MPEQMVEPRTPFKRLIDAVHSALKDVGMESEKALSQKALDLLFTNINYYCTRYADELVKCLKEELNPPREIQEASTEALRIVAQSATMRIGNDECKTLREKFASLWAVPRATEANSKRGEKNHAMLIGERRDVVASLNNLRNAFSPSYFDEDRYAAFRSSLEDEIIFYDELRATYADGPAVAFQQMLPIWIVKQSSPLYELSIWEDEGSMRSICSAVCKGFMDHKGEFQARDIEKRECENFTREIMRLVRGLSQCRASESVSENLEKLYALMERDEIKASQLMETVAAHSGNAYTSADRIDEYDELLLSSLISNWDDVREVARRFTAKDVPLRYSEKSVRELYKTLYGEGPDPAYERFPPDFPESVVIKAKLMWDLIGCSIYGPANITDWMAVSTDDGGPRSFAALDLALEAGRGKAIFRQLLAWDESSPASSRVAFEVELGSDDFETATPSEGLVAVVGRAFSPGFSPELQFSEDDNEGLYGMASIVGKDMPPKYFGTELIEDSAWHLGVFLEGDPCRIYLVDLGSKNGTYVIREDKSGRKRVFAFTGRDRGRSIGEMVDDLAKFEIAEEDVEIVGFLPARRGDTIVLGSSQFEIL